MLLSDDNVRIDVRELKLLYTPHVHPTACICLTFKYQQLIKQLLQLIQFNYLN